MKFVLGILVILLIPVLSLILFFPLHPVTLIGWVVWIGLATPLTLIGEYFSEIALSEKVSQRIDPKPTFVSFKRILYVLVLSLLALGIMFLVIELVEGSFAEFFESNFSYGW